MKPGTKKTIQIVLAVLLALAAIRLVWIFAQRGAGEPDEEPTETTAPPLNPDYYVTPKKLYAHDLESLKPITQQPVWIKEGYRYTYYPWDPQRRRANFQREAGVLPPIQRLEIQELTRQSSPDGRGQQVLAVFEKDGESFALPVGTAANGAFHIYADEMFYYEDPRQLYQHWPAEVWQAIERGEVRKGMNEIQASFAVGMGVPQKSSALEIKTVVYPRGGKPLTVTYRDGRAIEVLEGGSA